MCGDSGRVLFSSIWDVMMHNKELLLWFSKCIFETFVNFVSGGKTSTSQCSGAETPGSHQGELSQSAERSSTVAERPHRKVHIGMFCNRPWQLRLLGDCLYSEISNHVCCPMQCIGTAFSMPVCLCVCHVDILCSNN